MRTQSWRKVEVKTDIPIVTLYSLTSVTHVLFANMSRHFDFHY